MKKYIICPKCGKKINNSDLPVRSGTFFKYKICPRCNCMFSKLSEFTLKFINVFNVLMRMLKGVVFILIVISVYNSANGEIQNFEYTLFQYILIFLLIILLIIVIILIVVNDIISDKVINNSDNGFLTIMSSNDSKKIVCYTSEEVFQKNTSNKQELIKSTLDHATFIVPTANVSMNISFNSDIKELQLYYIYEILVNNKEMFFMLVNYTINDENILLFFKSMGDINNIKCNETYNLMLIDGRVVGGVKIVSIF